MSYQVLARKWRPKTFKAMVGQNHVLQALINALDHGRLHHAYLFTGTRGVGKTTIARILAKCLNCETGISSEPCGQCSACQEIDQGRFVDLLEVDAASRTKVEDTRELLDNVQYAPTRGRFKVYLIDEVHMLSAHSFNALLKTLEEPPPHVKFLLATTDPQKLPITILSRCLQFGLKNMPPERIVDYLTTVLEAEQVGYESTALWQIGRAADGSMRDALSLTDQAIAFGNGQVTEDKVAAMLGTIDQRQVYRVVAALASQQPVAVLAAVAHLAEFAPDYASVLADMLSVLHRVALAQMVPDAVDNSQGDQQQVLALATAMTAEDVQLFYQIGLQGRQDLAIAPDPRSGFEMVLLRMLAFRPQQGPVIPPTQPLPGNEALSTTDKPHDLGSQPNQTSNVSTTNTSSSASHVEATTQPEQSTEPQPLETSPTHTESTISQPAEDSTPSNSIEDASASAVQVPVPAAHDPVVAEPPSQQVTAQPSRALNPVATVNESVAELEAYQQYSEAMVPDYEYSTASAYQQSSSVVEPPVTSATPAAIKNPKQPVPGVAANTVDIPVANTSALKQAIVDEREHAADLTVTVAPTGTPLSTTEMAEPAPSATMLKEEVAKTFTLDTVQPTDWPQLYSQLSISGAANAIAQQMELVEITAGRWYFRIAKEHTVLLNDSQIQRVSQALSHYFATEIQVSLDQVVATKAETPAAYRARKRQERQTAAEQSIISDPNVQALMQHFSATIVENSVMPIDS
ncbi:DNA polymerase III subunit gamma/tau [Endozoicomonas sp. SM1973]|uniref:DNA polymerase III subunit gamma/tau n=1 Tax=Spartinivicinus marinus TaxID=2994442 RepID=A0A853HVV8_9GAMM|nr:DNA polymerase III subunit gamma/tau [Spartinivicinus marinus]MCX4029202.1 DNA polymerase III subunit gamma/tau [Spartinivicinus marinus]NYZ65890.1 DNA polymerase III subunit gamma/tau [Spartinivicinus marinus]